MGVPVGSIRRWQVLRHRNRSGPARIGGEGRKGESEPRGRTAHGGSWGAVTTVSDVKFARDVERGWRAIIGRKRVKPIKILANFPFGPSNTLVRAPTERAPHAQGLVIPHWWGMAASRRWQAVPRFPATAPVLARINSVTPWWGRIESAYQKWPSYWPLPAIYVFLRREWMNFGVLSIPQPA